MIFKNKMRIVCSMILCGFASGYAEAYQHGMTMITPADQWREALPTGNGMIGALVYGSISEERVLFNHNELWYGGQIAEVPDLSAELSIVRSLMLEGNYAEANNHYRNVMREKGFKGRNASYHPAFDLLVKTETQYLFEDYSRTVDFETGEISVQWRDGDVHFNRRLFVSFPDDLSVMSIKADQPQAVSGNATLDIHDLMDAIAQNGTPFDPGFTYETIIEDGYVVFKADGTDGGEFGGVMRVVVKNGEQEAVSPKGKGGIDSITFNAADEVLLIIGFYANETSDVAVPRLKEKLASAKDSYEALFNRHAPLQREKFNSMGVHLNVSGTNNTPNELLLLDAYQNPASIELIQKLNDYGRYLLITSSRAGGYPAGLQGIWNGDYRPPWSGLYGINENLQMTYWQGLPGNMKESMMAFYDYFDAHMDEFRTNAKQLFGCDGIYIPPFMSPDFGVMRHTAPHVVHWTDAAGWLASFYYDYYLFTGDTEFLESRAVPFMKAVALFYEDYIVVGSDGKNMLFPGQSPENSPAVGPAKNIKVQVNSTISVAISKEVFRNLIASCERLGIEEDGVERWGAMLAAMPEYEINEEGAMSEWLHPDFKDNYEHRHQSHIYPLFPGQEITEETTPELYEACKVAIEKRLTIGLKSQTGWSLAHMANVYARLGDGEKALEALNILSRCCLGQNLFTYHNDWRKMGATMPFFWGRTAPFQMDANFGIPAAVMEMLCGSNADMLRILPALPAEWSVGEFAGMLTCAGVMTSAQWDMSVKEIELTLTAQRDAVFNLQFSSEIKSYECSQPEVSGASEFGNQYRAISLNKGQQITIKATLQ